MLKNKYCVTTLILTTVLSGLLTMNQIKEDNSFNAEINDKTLNISEFKIDFELQSVTVKEDESYQMSNFIPEGNIIPLTNIDYAYKEESMGTYKDAGKYEIVIIFKNSYGNKIEKNTSLIIEKKTSEITQQNKENNKTKSNDISKKTTSTNQITKTNNIKKDDIESQILASDQKIGTHGRLYFSSLYSVALYRPNSNKDPQSIVDNKDSAAYFKYGKVMIIADHASQGFEIIKKQNVGDFVYIKKESADNNYILEKYIVREKTIGINTGTNLVTNDNRNVATDINYSLVLYTCNTNDYEVTILFLDKV